MFSKVVTGNEVNTCYIFIQSKRISVPSFLPSWIPYPLPLILLHLLLRPYEDEEEREDEEEDEEDEDEEDEEECHHQEEQGEAPQHQERKRRIPIAALRQGISVVLVHQPQVKVPHPRNLVGMLTIHPRRC